MNPIFGHGGRKINRTQRHPQYSRQEMRPFFAEVAKGYCRKQAADRCGYPREYVLNTLYSHDDMMDQMLMLAMRAGYRIRAGLQRPPLDRYDGLYSTEE